MRHLLLTSSVGLILVACTSVPQTITETEAVSNATSARAEITSQQEPVTQSISLYEAMARALKYNLDHNVAMMDYPKLFQMVDIMDVVMRLALRVCHSYRVVSLWNPQHLRSVMFGRRT